MANFLVSASDIWASKKENPPNHLTQAGSSCFRRSWRRQAAATNDILMLITLFYEAIVSEYQNPPMTTCVLSYRLLEAPAYELLLDPEDSATAETCVIDGHGYTAKRLLKKINSDTVEYRVFMVDDALLKLPPNELSKLADGNWERGYQVKKWHP